MIQIFYGFGKGKTSTLNGMALRARGANLKVLLIRFLKGVPTSEDLMLPQVGVTIKHFHHGQKFVYQMSVAEKEATKKQVNHGINQILHLYQKYDLIILDEFLDLVETKLKTETELINLIKQIQSKEVLLSGHYKLNKLFALADLITFYQSEKHYFERKIKARKGFEL